MSEPHRTPLGDAIQGMRLAAGLTQHELARAAGIERSYISMLESGRRRNASYEVLAELARALGVSTAHLYQRAGLEYPEVMGEPTALHLDDPDKLPVLRRLSHLSLDALIKLERTARIWLREFVPPESDKPDGQGVADEEYREDLPDS
jgi:transcriptional regulator with XRE-family HTH domain